MSHSARYLIPVVAAPLLSVAGCQSSGGDTPAAAPSEASVPASSAATNGSGGAGGSGATPEASDSSMPVASLSGDSAKASSTPEETAATGPQNLTLTAGKTAHLTNFDVTLLRQEFGKDGISVGWKVRTCYTKPHAGQNADGTTRVSTDPWRVQVIDGEGGTKAVWTKISEFPADKGWQPPYPERLLKLGDCAEGWIAVRHDNPDLQFQSVRYQPADTGDVVTWSTR